MKDARAQLFRHTKRIVSKIGRLLNPTATNGAGNEPYVNEANIQRLSKDGETLSG
jgi:hypothetical protein